MKTNLPPTLWLGNDAIDLLLRKIRINEKMWFGLDDNNVEVEKIPLLI